MSESFTSRAEDVTAPARHGFAVTPNDATDLVADSRAIYVGGAGTLAVQLVGGGTVSFAGLAAGTLLPVRVRRVLATGTSATQLVALS